MSVKTTVFLFYSYSGIFQSIFRFLGINDPASKNRIPQNVNSQTAVCYSKSVVAQHYMTLVFLLDLEWHSLVVLKGTMLADNKLQSQAHSLKGHLTSWKYKSTFNCCS